MDPREVATRFLTAALAAKRRDRFVEFVSKPKAEQKFLHAIWHDIADEFKPALIVPSLPKRTWDDSALLFSPYSHCEFGERHSSLRQAVESCPDAYLAITLDGQHGVYREEGSYRASNQILIALPRRAP